MTTVRRWTTLGAALMITLLECCAAGAPARAATSTPAFGVDLSAPRCSDPYPPNPSFAIVGVNQGVANEPNPCLAGELSWALGAPGLTSPQQPGTSLYIDTADPGPGHGVTDWPHAGSAPRYGHCSGTWTGACAYVYGVQRAKASFADVAAVNGSVARTAPWWLDVELSNTWADSHERGYGALNLAALRGFSAGLRAAGVRDPVGIYSFPRDWNQITALTQRTTAASFGGSSPPEWVGGTASLTQAQRACAGRGFGGVRPVLAQFNQDGYDVDLRCPAAASSRSLPSHSSRASAAS